MIRKSFTLLLIFILISTLFSGIAGANGKIELDVKGTPEKLDDNQYEVKIEIKNISKQQITGLEIDLKSKQDYEIIDKSSFPGTLDANRVQEVTLTLKDKQGSIPNKRYDVTLIVKEFGNEIYSYPVQLDSSNTDRDPEPPTPKPEDEDTTKKRPILHIPYNSDMPTGEAGKTLSFALPIKNNSNFKARNVMVNIGISDSSKQFVFERLNQTYSMDTIFAYATKNLPLELKIDPYTPEGTYSFTLNFKYTNEYGDAYESNETLHIRVKNNQTPPRLVLGQIEKQPQVVQAGEAIILKLELKNNGTQPAENINISLKGLNNEGFSLIGSSAERYLKSLAGSQSTTVEYTVQAAEEMSNGSYPLDVRIEYEDGQKQKQSNDQQFFIQVGGSAKQKGNIVLEKIEAPTYAVSANQDFPIRFQLVNNGEGEARNIKVSLSHDKEIIPKSLNTIMIPSLQPGGKKSLQFTLSATAEAESKNYPIAIQVEYESKDTKAEKLTASQYVGVFVQGDSGKTVPKIIIDRYSFAEDEVKAGENVHLRLSFLNTNHSVPVKNLKVSFTSDDGTFTTVGSNSFYFEQIAPGANVEEEAVLFIKPDAAPKVYHLTLDFDYADDKGTAHSAKETIGIPVNQDPRLTIGELNVSPEAFLGQPTPLYVDFYNMGKSTLYNLMITVEGDFQSPVPSFYVGNFEPGKSESFDELITPNSSGETHGEIVFHYEDHTGKPTEVRREFTLNVMEMNMEPWPDEMFPDEMGMEENSSSKKYLWIGGGSVAVLALIGGIIFWRKRKQKMKGMEFDELS